MLPIPPRNRIGYSGYVGKVLQKETRRGQDVSLVVTKPNKEAEHDPEQE